MKVGIERNGKMFTYDECVNILLVLRVKGEGPIVKFQTYLLGHASKNMDKVISLNQMKMALKELEESLTPEERLELGVVDTLRISRESRTENIPNNQDPIIF